MPKSTSPAPITVTVFDILGKDRSDPMVKEFLKRFKAHIAAKSK
jgi:hypothetical protein